MLDASQPKTLPLHDELLTTIWSNLNGRYPNQPLPNFISSLFSWRCTYRRQANAIEPRITKLPLINHKNPRDIRVKISSYIYGVDTTRVLFLHCDLAAVSCLILIESLIILVRFSHLISFFNRHNCNLVM